MDSLYEQHTVWCVFLSRISVQVGQLLYAQVLLIEFVEHISNAI